MVEGSGSQARVSMAHEALFQAWPALGVWIDEHKEHLLLARLAEVQASEWRKHHYDPAYLWHVDRLKHLQSALGALHDVSSREVHEFAYPQVQLTTRLNEDLPHDERLSIGLYLGELGDPREGVGVTADGLPDVLWCGLSAVETPSHNAGGPPGLPPFRIAKYPITWVQYRAFLEAEDGYTAERWWHDLAAREGRPGAQFRRTDNHPAENVSWYDAIAFCRWLSARLGYLVRLPTDLEWTRAWTAGAPERAWPWGADWSPEKSNLNEANLGRTTAVGMYPVGDSQDGLSDLAGNVWEWCLATTIGGSPLRGDVPSEPVEIDTECVIRGGSWYLSRFGARTVVRKYRTDGRDYAIGFRVCAP